MRNSEILRKQADVMDMAETAGVDWYRCIKFQSVTGEWRVFAFAPETLFGLSVMFATSVVNGEPVF